MSNVKEGNSIAVVVDNIRYDNLEVLVISDKAIAVKRKALPIKSQGCFVIWITDIQQLEIEKLEIKDPPGTLVTSLLVLFFLLV